MDVSAGSPGRVMLELFVDVLHLAVNPGGCRGGAGCEVCVEYRAGCGCPPRIHCDGAPHPACRVCDDCLSQHPATCIGKGVMAVCEHGFIGACAECDGSGQEPEEVAGVPLDGTDDGEDERVDEEDPEEEE